MALCLIAVLLGGMAGRAGAELPGLDAFEQEDASEITELSADTKAVFVLPGFLYVLRGGKRIWKSPALYNSFQLVASPRKIDLDGDGVLDTVWSGFQAHLGQHGGIFISLRGGGENYYVHYDVGGGVAKVEISSPMRREVARGFARYMRTTWAASGDAVMYECARIIEQGKAPLMPDPGGSSPELRRVHARALSLSRKKRLDEAVAVLDDFFRKYDYRKIDPEGKTPEVTAALNDYGFFLEQQGVSNLALPVLAYVLERSPERIPAYLNMADALRKEGGKYTTLAPRYYRKYCDLMVAAGKEQQIPRRVRAGMGAAEPIEIRP